MNGEKRQALLKGAGLIFAAVILFYLLVWLVDDVLNGMFKEWFYARFLSNASYSSLWRWPELKGFFITLFLIWLVLLVLIAGLVAHLNGRYCCKKQAQVLSQYLSAMSVSPDRLPALPDVYTEVEGKLAKLAVQAQRNQQLMEIEMQRKNDLITYLAHDLKTPLASVIGYLNLLEECPDLPAEQRAKYIGITLEKAYRLEQLINEFFDIIRFNLQSIIIHYEKINLPLMLQQMADEFYPLVSPQHKEIKVSAPESFTIWGDSDKLARVFHNILKNAVAYSYEDSVIYIAVQPVGEAVLLTFTNHGNPIPAQNLDTIFEKFYRLDASRSSQTGGAGLGLAIAKEIVEAHQGTISVKSDVEKTVFTVKLPIKI